MKVIKLLNYRVLIISFLVTISALGGSYLYSSIQVNADSVDSAGENITNFISYSDNWKSISEIITSNDSSLTADLSDFIGYLDSIKTESAISIDEYNDIVDKNNILFEKITEREPLYDDLVTTGWQSKYRVALQNLTDIAVSLNDQNETDILEIKL